MSVKVGAIIRVERQKKQYTQYYMAHMLNISQNYYSKLERGETDLTIKKLYEVSRILEIPVYELLPETDEGMSINTSFITKIWIACKLLYRKMVYSDGDQKIDKTGGDV